MEHRGILKSGKHDDRAIFVKKLIDRTKMLNSIYMVLIKFNPFGQITILKQFQIQKWV